MEGIEDLIGWAIIAAIAGAGLLTLVFSFFTVEQQTIGIVERFGRFVRLAQPGLNMKLPWIEWVADTEDLRVQNLLLKTETKTKDNVFVEICTAVQYFVLADKVWEASYKLDDTTKTISYYVHDVVRAKAPEIDLDDLFERKDEIAGAVQTQLTETMATYGYGIVKALVTSIEPDEKVKLAMNEINAATRLQAAAVAKGEADKILRVKAAEAEAQSKKLQGEGIAGQRMAIAEGLKASVQAMEGTGVSPREAADTVLLTQYLDTIRSLGEHSRSTTILLPHSPGGLGELKSQIRNAFLEAEQVQKPPQTVQ